MTANVASAAVGKVTMTTLNALLGQARAVCANAYSPYSKVRVGAAILTADGAIHCGVNVENASYGLTVCAERNAVFQAVAHGGPKLRIVAVAVYALQNKAILWNVSPCGACRQVLAEFATPDCKIIYNGATKAVVKTMAALLPDGFTLKT